MSVIHYDTLDKDILSALLEQIGIDGAGLAPPARINRSLTALETSILIRCNQIHRSRALARDRLIARHPTRKAEMHWSCAEAEVLEQVSHEQVRWINDMFFGGRSQLQVAPPPATEPDFAPSGLENKASILWDVGAAVAKRLVMGR